MAHRIFLSHKHEDKPVVEPVALRLREIFGEDAVFYDSWSIKPGEGIIEKMDEGLQAPEFVFFFVSERSLTSGLVKIDWQNALLKASKGERRLIPVRLHNVTLPEVLRQNLYIDMYSVGLEIGLNQIVNVVQGNSSFTPQHEGFSNLTWESKRNGDGSLEIIVTASHFMEPNPNFIVLLENTANEISVELGGGGPCLSGYYDKPFPTLRGNGFTIAPMGGAITPERPFKIALKPKPEGGQPKLLGVVHGWSEPFRMVPPKPAATVNLTNATSAFFTRPSVAGHTSGAA